MGQRESSEKRVSRDDLVEETDSVSPAKSKPVALDEDIDSILDEIDAVLEENAEDFVKSFVQKGGQ